MNKTNKIIWFMFLLVLFSAPSALAFDWGGGGLADTLGGFGRTIYDLVDDLWFRFGITFIFLFLIFYAVFAAGLNKVSVFQGDGALPNRPGKIVAVSLGLLGAMGVAYWLNFSAVEFTDRVLGIAGWYGAVAFGFLTFAIAYFNMKDSWGDTKWPMIVFCMGLGFVTYGSLIGDEAPLSRDLRSLGWVMILISLLFMIIGSFGGGAAESAGEGARDAIDRVTRPQGPSRVRNVRAEMQPDGKVKVSWEGNPSGENISSYEIQRRYARYPGYGLDYQLPAAGGNQTEVTDERSVEPGKHYRYQVRAVNQEGRRSPWGHCEFSVPVGTVSGRVMFRDHDGTEYPIEQIELSLSGTSNHGPIRSGNDGSFSFSNVGRNRGNYNLIIRDPHGVYRDVTFNDLVTDSRHNLGTIYLRPRTGVYSNVSAIINENGAAYASQSINAHVLGSPTRVGGPYTTDEHGKVIVQRVPAGYAVNMYVSSASHGLSHNPSNKILLRYARDVQLAQPIELTPHGSCSVEGRCSYIFGGSFNPAPGCEIVFENNTTRRHTSATADAHGNYRIDNLPAGRYKVTATHPRGRFVSRNDPVRDNYLVHSAGQRLQIIMIPGAPVPGRWRRLERDSSGDIIAEVVI